MTTCDKYLAGIVIIISVAIFATIIIVTSTVASLVIASSVASISSAAYPTVYIIIVVYSTAASYTLYVESDSAMTLSYWTLSISYAINLLRTLAVEGAPNIIRDVEDIRDMSNSDVSADHKLW